MKKNMKMSLLVTTLIGVGLLGACTREETKGKIEEGTVTDTSTSISSGEDLLEQNIDLKDDGSFKEIVTGKNDPKVKLEATYKTDYTDESWDDVILKIDKVKVVEVDKYTDDEDKDYKGLVSMHYKLENTGKEDIHLHPEKATLILEDGKEIEAEHFDDYWDDVFSKDKTKDGFVYFKFNKTDEIDNIKDMKLEFKGRQSKSDSDKVDHTYTVDLPLTPTK